MELLKDSESDRRCTLEKVLSAFESAVIVFIEQGVAFSDQSWRRGGENSMCRYKPNFTDKKTRPAARPNVLRSK
jgi:hypothetical protein